MQFFLHFLLFQLSQFNIFDTFNKYITETIPYGIPASMSVRLGQSFDTMYDVIL